MSKLAEDMLHNPESPEPTADVKYNLSSLHVRQSMLSSSPRGYLCIVYVRGPVKRETRSARWITTLKQSNHTEIQWEYSFFYQFTGKLAVSQASYEQGFTYLTALFVVKSNHHDMQHRSLQFVSAVRLHSPLMSWQSGVVLNSGAGQ